MKTQEEILIRMNEIIAEQDKCQYWFDEAHKRFQNDCKMFGKKNADYGECSQASYALNYAKAQVYILKWILS